MAREAKLKIFSVNIAMHAPHRPERYVELMATVYNKRRIITSRGLNGLLIGELSAIDGEDLKNGMRGEIYRFVKIDPDDPWFNLENKEEADAEDLLEINIPENLKPQLVRFPFVFFPKGHRMYVLNYYQGKSIGPSTVEKFLQDVFSYPDILRRWEVEVNVEPDQEGLESILEMHELHKLHIEIFRPNADDHNEEERELLERMENQGAKKIVYDMAASRTGELKPDAKTKTLARIGASNGKVTGSGRDEQQLPLTISTKEIPWLEPFYYDADNQTLYGALLEAAKEMHRKIIGR